MAGCLIERESLSLLNASNLCLGAITRNRVTKESNEKSIIDYMLTCEKLAVYLEQMLIDEQRNFPLTKYATTKGIKRMVKSDHNIMYGKFSMQYKRLAWRKPRKEVFNLKNPECQSKFKEVTNNSRKLQNCFEDGRNFEDQSNAFFKCLDDIMHQCFRKIRVGKQVSNEDITDLLTQKSKLKIALSKSNSQKAKSELEVKLNQVEEQLSKLSSTRNVKLVQEHIKTLGTADGRFSQGGMWKLKNKLWPKEHDPPMAKLDQRGNLIS